jgi:hypothetical protein
VARRLSAKGALEALQWARANGLRWDAGACRAAADGVYPQIKMELRRSERQNNGPLDFGGDRRWCLHRLDAETAGLKYSPGHMHLLAWLLNNKCEAEPEPALVCAGCLAAGQQVTIATAADLITDVFDPRRAAHRHGQWRLSATDFGDGPGRLGAVKRP